MYLGTTKQLKVSDNDDDIESVDSLVLFLWFETNQSCLHSTEYWLEQTVSFFQRMKMYWNLTLPIKNESFMRRKNRLLLIITKGNWH